MAKSLAAQAAAPTAGGDLVKVPDFGLPTIFGQNTGITVVPRFNTPYLIFAQPAALDQWRELMQKFPDIEDGDPVLFFPEPEKPIKFGAVRCTMLAAQQYYATRDAGGQELQRFREPGPDRAERIVSALIIYHEDRAIPCTCVFKTTKCGAAQKISSELERCQKPEWVKDGQEFEMAVAACSTPSARIVATITISGRTSKQGKGKGKSYAATTATIKPSGPVEWKLLADLQQNRRAELEAVAGAYSKRLSELDLK